MIKSQPLSAQGLGNLIIRFVFKKSHLISGKINTDEKHWHTWPKSISNLKIMFYQKGMYLYIFCHLKFFCRYLRLISLHSYVVLDFYEILGLPLNLYNKKINFCQYILKVYQGKMIKWNLSALMVTCCEKSTLHWWSMILRLELDLSLIDVTDQKFDFPRTFTT